MQRRKVPVSGRQFQRKKKMRKQRAAKNVIKSTETLSAVADDRVD